MEKDNSSFIQPQPLIRTILEKTWVRDGEVHWTAFQPKKQDIKGISLFFEKREAGKRFNNPIFGLLNVYQDVVEKISNGDGFLKIVEDLDDPGHLTLIGIPYFYHLQNSPERTDLKKRSELIASEVADQASEINQYEPEGFSPKILLE